MDVLRRQVMIRPFAFGLSRKVEEKVCLPVRSRSTDFRLTTLISLSRSRMGCQMRRVASYERTACVGKQGQSHQVLGSTDRHGTLDIVSYHRYQSRSRNTSLFADINIKTLSKRWHGRPTAISLPVPPEIRLSVCSIFVP